MIRYASTIILLLIFVQPALPARMKVNNLNYSESWKIYLNTQASLLPVKRYPYENCFTKTAERYGLPLTLLLAMAKGESDFNPQAKSSKSCYGIMQIQWPGTAKDLGFTNLSDLYHPCQNIDAGAKYFKMLLNRYDGDLHLALAAYNYGPGRISKRIKLQAVPKGANWYSGYIYHHLQTILVGAVSTRNQPASGKHPTYTPGTKIPVILFHSPIKARRFLDYFETRAPNINLDWFRTSLGETYVVLVVESENEIQQNILRMRELGFYLDTKTAFK
ncbi:MAG: lytic transglycosylase domain-containing protein [Desulfobacter sp.]